MHENLPDRKPEGAPLRAQFCPCSRQAADKTCLSRLALADHVEVGQGHSLFVRSCNQSVSYGRVIGREWVHSWREEWVHAANVLGLFLERVAVSTFQSDRLPLRRLGSETSAHAASPEAKPTASRPHELFTPLRLHCRFALVLVEAPSLLCRVINRKIGRSLPSR